MLAQEENEHDFEIVNAKKDAQRELNGQKSLCHQLRKEQDALLRGLDMMERDKERVAKEQTEASTNIRNLRLQTEDLTRQVNGLRHERRERESTLVEKEKKIAEYKQKVATLKKFKHVLDFRL